MGQIPLLHGQKKRVAEGNHRGTTVRKWILSTAEKQPVGSKGVGVEALGQSSFLPRGILGPICSNMKMKVTVGARLPYPARPFFILFLFWGDDVETVVCSGWCLSSHIAGKAEMELGSLWC